MKNRFTLFILLTILLSALIGGTIGNKVSAGSTGEVSLRELLRPFTEAIDVIDRHYFEKVPPEKLIQGAIRGMLRSLDPHSTFFDKRDFARLREEQHSKYSGLGIRVRQLIPGVSGRVVIYEPPFPGSPAAKKGLRAGDVITRINGEPIDDWPLDDVISNLKGPKGTSVRITVERPGLDMPMELEIVRDEIPLYSIHYAFMIRPGIGYIRIDRFSESTGDELERKLKELGERNLNALILDLRDNPGGLLNQGVEIADKFIPEGKIIVTTKGRDERSRRDYRATDSPKRMFPIVVLINRQSASASEIVAGAIQDHDRGLIVGETSFGKGLVQSVYTLSDNTGLALTTARWYTPSGRLIQRSYSGSIYDYLWAARRNRNDEPPAAGEVYYTDGGRPVYGGGGIRPDVVVTMRELNSFERKLLAPAKDIFFEYARRLTSGQIAAGRNFSLSSVSERKSKDNSPAAMQELMRSLEITPEIIEDFKGFLREKNIDFAEKDIADNLQFIKRNIKKSVFDTLFGTLEGYKVAIEGDEQVMKALELIPEAENLLKLAKAGPTKRAQR